MATSNLLFVEGPTFQRAWLKSLSYFEYQSKVHLEMSSHIKEKFAVFLSSGSNDLQASRRSIDLALGNSMKAKNSELKKQEAADNRYTKACSVLKTMEAELTRETEEYAALQTSPEKKSSSATTNQAMNHIKNIGKLLGTEPKSNDARIASLQEQIKIKKLLADEAREEFKACQSNVKVADQAHQSLLLIIQQELKATISRSLGNINEKISELLNFYQTCENKIKMEQFEVSKVIIQIDNDEDILDFSRENASELNLSVDIIPLPDKLESELNEKGKLLPVIVIKSPTKEINADKIKYDVSFPGKNLGIKFRRQGEKLIVRKLNNEEGEDVNEDVKLGSEVIAIDGTSVANMTGDEVIDKIRNSPRPIKLTFAVKRVVATSRKSVRHSTSPRKITAEPGKDALTQLKSTPEPTERARRSSRSTRETLSAEDVTFQVMFGLPPEEVVIASFSCAFYPYRYIAAIHIYYPIIYIYGNNLYIYIYS